MGISRSCRHRLLCHPPIASFPHSVTAHRAIAQDHALHTNQQSDGGDESLYLCKACRLDDRDFRNGKARHSGVSTWPVAKPNVYLILSQTVSVSGSRTHRQSVFSHVLAAPFLPPSTEPAFPSLHRQYPLSKFFSHPRILPHNNNRRHTAPRQPPQILPPSR